MMEGKSTLGRSYSGPSMTAGVKDGLSEHSSFDPDAGNPPYDAKTQRVTGVKTSTVKSKGISFTIK